MYEGVPEKFSVQLIRELISVEFFEGLKMCQLREEMLDTFHDYLMINSWNSIDRHY